jgi:Putative MetA-pathway of phenol degradation
MVAACGLFLAPLSAQEANGPMAKGIQDNSFLIEEAYNQEPGMVQHIATLRRLERDWLFAFTQEWPVRSQAHQLSYTVPYSWLRSGGQSADGFGDLMLNYRWQALMESASTPAVAPRLSLILPTGDADRGLGFGSVGYQINLPVSKIVSDRVTLHGNAGLTTYADIDGRSPVSYNLGASAIYAVSRDFNLMLEGLVEWNATVSGGIIERETSFTLSPGVRKAFDLAPGQLVVGAAMPVRFTGGETDFGVFVYLSVEHSFLK